MSHSLNNVGSVGNVVKGIPITYATPTYDANAVQKRLAGELLDDSSDASEDEDVKSQLRSIATPNNFRARPQQTKTLLTNTLLHVRLADSSSAKNPVSTTYHDERPGPPTPRVVFHRIDEDRDVAMDVAMSLLAMSNPSSPLPPPLRFPVFRI